MKKKYKTEEKVNTEESNQESLKLATSEFNKDGVPLVSINLIGKYFANYQEAYWSEYWEINSGTGVVMIVKQNNDDKQLFNDVLYLEAHDENIVNELEIFHDDDEEYCENAMWQCIVFYQTGSEDYSEDVWRNTCKALQLIFKPERSSVDGERYDGPKAIFNIKAAWSDEDGDEEDSPFYNCNFRIYKNDKDEWVSKQLD